MLKFFKKGLTKFKEALSKTKRVLADRIRSLFKDPLNEETLEQLEQILFEADLGSHLSMALVDEVRRFVKSHPNASSDEILRCMKEHGQKILNRPPSVEPKAGTPQVILIVGVNGSGKTTTIAKLAHKLKDEGKSVLLAAADTFRAAAVEQLTHWSEKAGVQIVKGRTGSDPSAVVYDALEAAKARRVDVVLIDTAGRLQNKTELMHELEKIKRTCSKLIPDSPHETILIVDATTGQNGLDQAETFHQFTPLTSIIVTKLDGSAKGGIALALYEKLSLPIRYVGLGEGIDHFEAFDPESYLNALFDL